jgi:hypothetical protein
VRYFVFAGFLFFSFLFDPVAEISLAHSAQKSLAGLARFAFYANLKRARLLTSGVVNYNTTSNARDF